ncbi:MAG: alpha-amylase [Pseudonocardiales bacterium]|nr:MAG: alpha-amylase [Pseudonocardiales bacterium]
MTAQWWRSAVIYQIYPRSFADADGDGHGDLDGITSRLDHLSSLGVDALWLNPFYVSPMADGGYDIADHTDVDPLFGDLAAFDRLLKAAHAQRLRVIIDFVPNHTSSRHQWFQESTRSRQDLRRDWYIWHAGRPGTVDGAGEMAPPNNWVSAFGGSAWTYHPETGQWYLHTFLPDQPDLNWRNPQVEAAMFDVLRFWLNRGVDGFRVDVANFILKDPELRDNPPRDPDSPTAYRALGPYDAQIHLHDKGHPDTHPLYRRLRGLLDQYRHTPDAGGLPAGDRVALGELHTFDWPDWLRAWASYYGATIDGRLDPDAQELHLPLNLALIGIPFNASAWREAIDAVEAALPHGAWPTLILGSHDESRVASRVGSPAAARLAMTALLTLRGTPILYYGEEIAMTDVPVTSDQAHDRWGAQDAEDDRAPSLGPSGGSSVGSSRGLGRDPQRTPMRWHDGHGAGFTAPGAAPWLPLGLDTAHSNVASQTDDPTSMLTLTRTLLTLRRAYPALAIGDYEPLDDLPDGVLGYLRVSPDASPSVIVLLNFTDTELTLDPDRLPMPPLPDGRRPLLSTIGGTSTTVPSRLSAHQGLLIALP